MPPSKKPKSKIVLTSITSQSVNQSAGMKFRPNSETPREQTKGKLPCAEAASIQQIILMMVVHLCRKVIYGFDVSYRIGFYILGTLLISVVSDYKSSTASRSYFANPDNFLNQWFVKMGWAWTLILIGSFSFFTARTYSCGKISVIRNTLFRLILATVAWATITYTFQVVEAKSGVCEVVRFTRKESCLSHGHLWKGFDISGHCFILIFCNLFIIEEGKAYLGWERIRDYLRNEEHKRINDSKDMSDTPLSKLKNEEYLWLRKFYPLDTGYVRFTFCLLALLTLLWDTMLLSTLFFFHMMIEKVVASGIAVLLWFCLYKFLYKHPLSPGLPGEGPFKYVTWKEPERCGRRSQRTQYKSQENNSKWSSKDEIPKFMGMPLYALKDYKAEAQADTETQQPGEVRDSSLAAAGLKRGSIAGGRMGSISDVGLVRPLGRNRSRSQSRTRLASSKNSLNIKY